MNEFKPLIEEGDMRRLCTCVFFKENILKRKETLMEKKKGKGKWRKRNTRKEKKNGEKRNTRKKEKKRKMAKKEIQGKKKRKEKWRKKEIQGKKEKKMKRNAKQCQRNSENEEIFLRFSHEEGKTKGGGHLTFFNRPPQLHDSIKENKPSFVQEKGTRVCAKETKEAFKDRFRIKQKNTARKKASTGGCACQKQKESNGGEPSRPTSIIPIVKRQQERSNEPIKRWTSKESSIFAS